MTATKDICGSVERIAAMVSATAICLYALHTDGMTAITLSLGVAASFAGISGYAIGKVRALANK